MENMIVSLLDAEPAAKETLIKLPEAAVREERKAADKVSGMVKKEIAHQPLLLDGAIAVIGVLLLLPVHFFNIFLAGALFLLFAAETAFTVRRLIRNHWNTKEERTRIILCIILCPFCRILLHF